MKRLVVFACALVLAMGLAACSGSAASSTGGSGGASASSGSAASGEGLSASSSSTSSSADESASSAAVTVDVSNVDFDVAAMSDDDAFAFMDEFTNRAPDALDADEGKVMHIKGQVSRNTKKDDAGEHVSCSVGIKGEGGVLKGVNFYVEGWSADDYPANKAEVEVTGVWGKVDGYGTNAGRTLICNASDVIVAK